jgi:hypothetical protein
LDPQAAGELLGIFNNLLETKQAINGDSGVWGLGFAKQFRDQELREQELRELELKAKH